LSNKGEGIKMNRKFLVLMLCSLLLITTVGTVMAGNPDYSFLEYWAQVPATVDGEWTSPDEWTDGPVIQLSDDANFVYVMDSSVYGSQFVVEIFSDDTEDAEDYWQICFDDGEDGGSTPQSGDYRIDIEGHTDLVFYAGNGQGWDEITPDSGEIEWAESISDSPWNSTSHWILEINILKTVRVAPSPPPTGLRVAVYDANNPNAGVLSWPPDSSVDVPDEWGSIPTYSDTPIPEGLNFAVMAFLSSVSLVLGAHYLHKRSKKRETV
jgi:hypothetical protein